MLHLSNAPLNVKQVYGFYFEFKSVSQVNLGFKFIVQVQGPVLVQEKK